MVATESFCVTVMSLLGGNTFECLIYNGISIVNNTADYIVLLLLTAKGAGLRHVKASHTPWDVVKLIWHSLSSEDHSSLLSLAPLSDESLSSGWESGVEFFE